MVLKLSTLTQYIEYEHRKRHYTMDCTEMDCTFSQTREVLRFLCELSSQKMSIICNVQALNVLERLTHRAICKNWPKIT